MNRLKTIFVLTLLTMLGACAQLLMPEPERELSQLPEGNYHLDTEHARVLFKVDHLGISSYVGRFNTADASLQYSAEAPEASRLTATVTMASLDVNDADFASQLVGCDWLCAERYPQAVFETTAEAEVQGERLVFPGQLRFRGVTQAAQMAVNVRGGVNNRLTGRYTIGFDAELAFKRSDFGMDKYIPLVGDQVVIEIYAEFLREE